MVLSAFSALGPDHGQTRRALDPAEVDRIIRAFTAKEAEFRRALNSYSFKRDALIQRIGMGGQVTGEYHRVSTFTFDDQGNRYEKISFFPMSTMPEGNTRKTLTTWVVSIRLLSSLRRSTDTTSLRR